MSFNVRARARTGRSHRGWGHAMLRALTNSPSQICYGKESIIGWRCSSRVWMNWCWRRRGGERMSSVQYSVREINKTPGTTHLEVEAGLGSTRVLFDEPWADATVSASKAGEALRFEIGDTAEATFNCSGGVLSLVRSTTLAPESSLFSILTFVLASFAGCALIQIEYTLVAR